MSNAHLTDTLKNKRLQMFGSAWIDPCGSITFFDDFNGKAFNATDVWTTTQVGTSVPSAPTHDGDAGDPVAGHGGWLLMGSDNADDKSSEIALTNESEKGNFRVSRAGGTDGRGMLVFEAVMSHGASVSDRVLNLGFSDDESEAAGTLALQFGAGDVITANADNAACWVYDTLATDDGWRGCSVNATAVGTATGRLGAWANGVRTAGVATVNTATKLRIEVDSAGNAFFFGRQESATIYPEDPLGTNDFVGSQALAVATTLSAIPYLGAGATTTTTADMEVDYVFVACSR